MTLAERFETSRRVWLSAMACKLLGTSAGRGFRGERGINGRAGDVGSPCVFSFGSPLPIPLREKAREYLLKNALPEDEVHLFHPMSPSDVLDVMSAVERNLFDRLHGSRLALTKPRAFSYRTRIWPVS